MFNLERIRPAHEAAVLAFELANRAYFSNFISDRGDDYFEQFPVHFRELLAEQEARTGAYYVLVDEERAVVGRFNLYRLRDDAAEVGFRVAQRVSGQGVTTSVLGDLCRLARDEYGLGRVTAMASEKDVASRRVLEKAGFVPVGPVRVAGKPGISYERSLG